LSWEDKDSFLPEFDRSEPEPEESPEDDLPALSDDPDRSSPGVPVARGDTDPPWSSPGVSVACGVDESELPEAESEDLPWSEPPPLLSSFAMTPVTLKIIARMINAARIFFTIVITNPKASLT
jgi:hypothetical protein